MVSIYALVRLELLGKEVVRKGGRGVGGGGAAG